MTTEAFTIVGQVVGSYFGPVGAAIGGVIGAALGSAIEGPQEFMGPRLQDLRSPKLQYGARWPRIHGRMRTAGIIIWQSDIREVLTTTESGGKGGPTSVSTTATYYRDVLYGLADGYYQTGAITRIWRNGTLIFSVLADSPVETINASQVTTAWSAQRFHNGAPDQLPDTSYEAAVGPANAIAYRNRATVMLDSVNQGGFDQLPFFEFELVSNVEVSAGVTRLQTYFDNDNSSDISSYNNGPGTLNGATIGSGTFNVSRDNAAQQFTPSTLTYQLASIGADLDVPIAIEMYATYGVAPNVSYVTLFEYLPNAADDTIYRRFGYYAGTGQMVYDDSGFGTEWTSPGPILGRTHLSMVFGATSFRVYVAGQMVLEQPGDSRPGVSFAQGAVILGDQAGYSSGTTAFTIDEFAVRFEEQYTGTSFAPPLPHIKTPDGGTGVPGVVDLADVVSAEHMRANGGVASEFDVTELVGQEVIGVAFAGSARESIEILRPCYYFDAVCSDKVYYRLRGRASSADIAFNDTAAGEGSANDTPFVGPARDNDSEVAAKVHFTYSNLFANYDNGTEQADRLIGVSNKIDQIQLPIVFTPPRAKGIAETIAADGRLASMTARIQINDSYARLEPTDEFTVTDPDGNIYLMRSVETMYANGVNDHQLALTDTSVLQTIGITSERITSTTTVQLPGAAGLVLIDGPIGRDADNDSGLYAVMEGIGTAGGVVFKSHDNITYTIQVTIGDQGVIGLTTDALGPWAGGYVFDEVNSVTVDLGNATMTSSTEAAMLLDPTVNAWVIGTDGRWEIGQSRDAALVSVNPNVYKLTGHLRGRRGTEHNIGNHAIGDTFVKLQGAGIRRIQMPSSELGTDQYWKGAAQGQLLDAVTAQALSNDAVGLKPFSPVMLRFNYATNTLSWVRRTRLATRFTGPLGINAPLGEASERYLVKLYDAGDLLVGSQIVTTPSYTVSSLMQGQAIIPVFGLRVISGELVAVQDGFIGLYTTLKYFLRIDATTGLQIARSPDLGHEVYQWTNAGDELYAVTAEFNSGVPTTYRNSKAQRFTRTSITTAAATYTAPTAGDLWGIAHDGTDIWVAEFYSGNLRKLNATTLASVSATAIAGGPTSLLYDSGSLWICCSNSNQVVKWTIATTTEALRFSVVSDPSDLIIINSLLFVSGSAQVGVYNPTTGALIVAHNINRSWPFAQRSIAVFGAYVVVSTIDAIVLLDATTGAFVRTVDPGLRYLHAVAGTNGATLYLTGEPDSGIGTSSSKQTYPYTMLAPANIAGYRATVAQISEVVGAGYETELEL